MKLPGMKQEPKTPEISKTPDTPTKPVRQRPGDEDVFRLPLFISEADQKAFYFRWPRENNWYKLQNAGYEKVIDPDTEAVVRIPTKDSEGDHILVRLPMNFREEDLQFKREAANEVKDTPNMNIKGATLHELED